MRSLRRRDITQLVAGAGKAMLEFDRMAKWPAVPVLDATAIEVFKALPVSSERLVADLNVAWTNTKHATGPNGGATLRGLYNTLTAGQRIPGEGEPRQHAR